jgi:anti-sigma B factor antagonist
MLLLTGLCCRLDPCSALLRLRVPPAWSQEVSQMAEVSFPVELVGGGVPIVAAPEEIDTANAAGLRAALLQAAGYGNGTLVVDMSQTQFCDSAGLLVLVRAHQRAQAEGGEVLLVISAATVLRIFAITGIDRMIPNFSTLEEALAQTMAVPGSPRPPAALSRTAPARREALEISG